MNSSNGIEDDSYKQLLILEELSRNGEVTQRDVSRHLGIALGLVNSYIKNLVSKGYITVATIPRKRYAYYLTPNGFIEKSRLAYQHLHNFTNLYNIARKDFRSLFERLQSDGIKRVAFCGVDEVAEIAYLTLKEFDLELVGVVDNKEREEPFFEFKVGVMVNLRALEFDGVLVTSHERKDNLHLALLDVGIPTEKIIVNGTL